MKRSVLFSLVLLLGIEAIAQDDIYLSDIEPVSANAAWFGLVRDKIHNKYPIILSGTEYKKGLLTHAPAKIDYKIEKKYTTLTAVLGLWDSGKRVSQDIYKGNERDWRGPGNGVVFEIWCDSVKVFDSGIITWQKDCEIRIDISNTETLTLIVTSNGDPDSDWAVWANIMLLK